jgi:hypothetical protein
MNRTIVVLVLSVVASLLLPGSALSQTPALKCPNTQASDIPLDVELGGVTLRCGGSIIIDGLTISSGSNCAQLIVITPAHQICQGVPLPGSKCVPQGDMKILVHHYECRAEYWLLGVFGASIRCTPALVNGYPYVTDGGVVEDFQTKVCNPDPVSGGSSG